MGQALVVVEGHSPPTRVQSLQPGTGVIHAAVLQPVLQPRHRVKSSKLDQRRNERPTFYSQEGKCWI